jgi:hypothetical protein
MDDLSRMIDITGKKFHSLTAIEPVGKNASGTVIWKCACDCGVEIETAGGNLRAGRVTSCGCLLRKQRAKNATTHGRTGTKEHKAWTSVIQRCQNQKNPGYSGYGGRGIEVCDRWKNSFENFLTDMGEAPSKALSIDRIDNDKDYEPSNCKWSTRLEQQSNLRSNIYFAHDGLKLHLSEWARRLSISIKTVGTRRARGWSIEEALFTPVAHKKRSQS